jgi:hypothetical protein
MTDRGALAASVLIGGWLAVAGCGTKTVAVTAPVKAPPPSAQTTLSASQSAGEEGIHHSMRPSAGFRARQVPRFTPATGCGVEGWSVKTLTDPGASQINLTSEDSSVLMLDGIAPPRDPTDRVAPTETTVFRLTGVQMTAFKREADSDIHLAIKDAGGRTMIVELPSAGCDSMALPALRSKMSSARDAFVVACGQPTSSYQTVTGRATMSRT